MNYGLPSHPKEHHTTSMKSNHKITINAQCTDINSRKTFKCKCKCTWLTTQKQKPGLALFFLS